MKILLLCGSTRADSYTRAAVQEAAACLSELGAAVQIWDPAEHPLPIADPAYHRDPSIHPDPAVQRFVAMADWADGFVLGTPNYHNSYSGVLKNALDTLTVSQFKEKPVALIGHGTSHSVIGALDHLRIVMRGLHALAIPQQVLTTPDDFEGLRLVNPAVTARLSAMCSQLCRLVKAAQGAVLAQ